MVDALGYRGDEGRGVTAISFGEVSSNLWSGDFRMRKLNIVKTILFPLLVGKRTWGSETSQYPEEQKINIILLVAASEKGIA